MVVWKHEFFLKLHSWLDLTCVFSHIFQRLCQELGEHQVIGGWEVLCMMMMMMLMTTFVICKNCRILSDHQRRAGYDRKENSCDVCEGCITPRFSWGHLLNPFMFRWIQGVIFCGSIAALALGVLERALLRYLLTNQPINLTNFDACSLEK
jgi:hypothetical protein